MLFLLASCKKNIGNNGIYVENATELKNAIEQSKPGDNIILSNGIWKNTGITFYGHGTKDKPISIIAETPGKAIHTYIWVVNIYTLADSILEMVTHLIVISYGL